MLHLFYVSAMDEMDQLGAEFAVQALRAQAATLEILQKRFKALPSVVVQNYRQTTQEEADERTMIEFRRATFNNQSTAHICFDASKQEELTRVLISSVDAGSELVITWPSEASLTPEMKSVLINFYQHKEPFLFSKKREFTHPGVGSAQVNFILFAFDYEKLSNGQIKIQAALAGITGEKFDERGQKEGDEIDRRYKELHEKKISETGFDYKEEEMEYYHLRHCKHHQWNDGVPFTEFNDIPELTPLLIQHLNFDPKNLVPYSMPDGTRLCECLMKLPNKERALDILEEIAQKLIMNVVPKRMVHPMYKDTYMTHMVYSAAAEMEGICPEVMKGLLDRFNPNFMAISNFFMHCVAGGDVSPQHFALKVFEPLRKNGILFFIKWCEESSYARDLFNAWKEDPSHEGVDYEKMLRDQLEPYINCSTK